MTDNQWAISAAVVLTVSGCVHGEPGSVPSTSASPTISEEASTPMALHPVHPTACMPNAGDYTHMWWAEGFPARGVQAPWLRCIQTGRYAMALNTQTMRIPHLGPLDGTPSYAAAAGQDNSAAYALPPAELELEVCAAGNTYRCVRGGKQSRHAGPRLIASGRFLQRADVTGLVFQAGDGTTLPVEARLETVAWPDRLTLRLIAQPKLESIAAGSTFGRVGGGFGFSGRNDLGEPAAAELDPAQFTLAFWVYAPADYRATKHYPWLICKGGSEWGDGCFGIMLREGGKAANSNGVPRAVLNIGGGKENTHIVTAVRQERYDWGLEVEEWHHLAMTYDGQDLKLYMDGKPAGSTHVGLDRKPIPAPIAFARRQDNHSDGYRFRGVLDEVRLYKRALTAAEIRTLADAPETSGPDAGLVKEWAFDPNGEARQKRPVAAWDDASMSVRLKTGEQTFEETTRSSPGEPWTGQSEQSVAVVVPFPVPPAAGNVRVAAADLASGKEVPVAHEPELGWHHVDLDKVVQQGEQNDKIERVRLKIANSADTERPVRLLFARTTKLSVTGVSMVLRDLNGHPTGIPVQLSKNWHRAADRRLPHDGPWFHGFSMLSMPPRSETEFELTVVYAHWGGVAAASHAQLSLIGWGSNQLWDESAMGSWGENICYEPDRAQAQALITDVRPLMVNAMKRDEPVQWAWTNNVGGGDTFRLFAPNGTRVPPTRMRAVYHRHGPCLTEVSYAGELSKGAIEHRTTVSLYRSNDITRGIYRLRMEVREPVAFSRFVLFQTGCDTYSYTGEKKMAHGNAAGLIREWGAQWGGNAYRTDPMRCTGDAPWFSLHQAVSRDKSKAGAWANRGVVLRHWEATLGGQPASVFAAEHGVKARGKNTSTLDFVPPPGVTHLQPGDRIDAVFEHIIVPQKATDYYGPNEALRRALEKHADTWQMIHREAVGNHLDVEVTSGTLERRRPAVRVRAAADRAEFAVTGGLGYTPVTICGLRSPTGPVLEGREPGAEWQVIDQSVHGNDFWQADYVADTATWELTYTVPSDAPGDERVRREYRFHRQQ